MSEETKQKDLTDAGPQTERPVRNEAKDATPELKKGPDANGKRSQELTTVDQARYSVLNINDGEFPDLEKAEEFPIDLSVEYWTPEKAGETKRVIFDGIRDREVVVEDSGEVFTLPCAFFLEKTSEGIKTICNGSKRLVGAIENNDLPQGTAIAITYLGKKKNANNSYMSDRWSVRPLVVKQKS